MRQFRAQGVILNRTDYGEADRIMTFLTPDHGKVKAIAKGVRKSKSKLAGGIELFSVSDLSFIVGKSEINTLRSSRLIKHYGDIVKDLDRTNLAYELIKMLDKATEDSPEADYFHLLREAFEALENHKISLGLIRLWFSLQILRLAGHSPNLTIDSQGDKLDAGKRYDFDLDRMSFSRVARGKFTADHIKIMRLALGTSSVRAINRVKGVGELADVILPAAQSMLRTFVRQ